jgi:hypothetical protein
MSDRIDRGITAYNGLLVALELEPPPDPAAATGQAARRALPPAQVASAVDTGSLEERQAAMLQAINGR